MLRKTKSFFKRNLSLSEKETSAFTLLAILMIIFIALPRVFHQEIRGKKQSHKASNQMQLDSLMALIEYEETEPEESEEVEEVKISYPRFGFDPNTASQATFETLGFKIWLAKRIINYRNAKGTFRIKRDLLNIYGMDSTLYYRLENYIELPDEIFATTKPKSKFKKEWEEKVKKIEITPFELNSATREELQQIRGIGEKISERIIKYRDLLGGFHDTTQLYKIYGLDSAVIDKLLSYSTLDKYTIRKINVNLAGLEELRTHPCINYYHAKAIIAYRQQHGPFTSVKDLLRIKIIDKESFKEMKEYLEIKTL